MSEWIRERIQTLRGLRGATVTSWVGTEMAVREVGEDGTPQWYDPTVPALQLERLDLVIASGAVRSITTYQNDDRWGLCLLDVDSVLQPSPPEPGSIFRTRRISELPCGTISSVDVRLESGDIAVVNVGIGEHVIRFQAAEVYEQMDGSLRVADMDESVLVQLDGTFPGAPR